MLLGHNNSSILAAFTSAQRDALAPLADILANAGLQVVAATLAAPHRIAVSGAWNALGPSALIVKSQAGNSTPHQFESPTMRLSRVR